MGPPIRIGDVGELTPHGFRAVTNLGDCQLPSLKTELPLLGLLDPWQDAEYLLEGDSITGGVEGWETEFLPGSGYPAELFNALNTAAKLWREPSSQQHPLPNSIQWGTKSDDGISGLWPTFDAPVRLLLVQSLASDMNSLNISLSDSRCILAGQSFAFPEGPPMAMPAVFSSPQLSAIEGIWLNFEYTILKLDTPTIAERNIEAVHVACKALDQEKADRCIKSGPKPADAVLAANGVYIFK
ncbi:hypothetical protein BKA70DRAFT_1243652 [Coprinopsis sp. MPI-PUGE-AT-0042]|nr:hypothetical protein BKA70DRAFT_1243652 [Coprinopsis sp. MPI-PUGE-AT-0042]